ncbi:MAG: ATP-binding cassette domain-containing protein [Bifidobacterium adolescentis]
MLEVKNLSVSYGAIEAVKDISFTVNDGEIVSLIGANGAGKTTTLHTITGLVPAKSGSVMYNGVDLLKTHNNKIVTLGMAHIPEGRHVFTRMSVEENLEMGAFSLKDQSDLKKDLDMVYGLFPRLKERRNQKAGTLVRRRAADAGDGPRADEPSEDDPHGRAVHGPVPEARQGDLLHHPQAARAGHHDSAGRAERQDGAVDRRPRIRAGNRPYHDGRRRQGTAATTSRCARRIWAPDSCRIRLVGLDASKPTGLFLYPMEYSPVVFPPFGRAIEPCLTIGKLTG